MHRLQKNLLLFEVVFPITCPGEIVEELVEGPMSGEPEERHNELVHSFVSHGHVVNVVKELVTVTQAINGFLNVFPNECNNIFEEEKLIRSLVMGFEGECKEISIKGSGEVRGKGKLWEVLNEVSVWGVEQLESEEIFLFVQLNPAQVLLSLFGESESEFEVRIGVFDGGNVQIEEGLLEILFVGINDSGLEEEAKIDEELNSAEVFIHFNIFLSSLKSHMSQC